MKWDIIHVINESMNNSHAWIFKSEPCTFSIEHLANSPNSTTCWDGVRNYQARNFLRDTVKIGDFVLFYHSNANPSGIVGLCEVIRSGYPDSKEPTWFCVDVKLIKKWPSIITLAQLREYEELNDLLLLKKGQRLSIIPISLKHFQFINQLSQ